MEVKIIEDAGSKIVFEIEGATHTLCNSLKQELWNDDTVAVAGYNINHPLVGKPKFVLETKKGDAKKAVEAAIKRLEKTFDDLGKQASKELK